MIAPWIKAALKTLLSLLTISLVLTGCTHTPQKPGETPSQAGEQAAAASMPSDHLEQFAFDLLKDLRNKDFDQMLQRYDHEGFMLQVAKVQGLKAAHKVAINKALSKNPKFIFSFLEEATSLYEKAEDVQLVDIDAQQQTILYRIYSESGLDYLEIHYRETSEDQYQFVDVEEFLLGYRMSTLTALTLKEVIQLSSEGNESGAREVLAYLKNFKEIKNGQIENFDNRLPTYVQDNELFLYLQALVEVNASEDLSGSYYREFYQRFPDSANHQLLFAYTELALDRHESALKHFSRLPRSLAQDAAILNLQCQQHAALGQFQQAADFCFRAIKAEPTFDSTFFTLTDLFLQINQPELAFDALKVLRDRFYYQIDEEYLRNNPRLETLRSLPGFADWITEGVQTS
ncbi:hypothetical protein BTA51_16140 [Hahella sp. CCB-MM4]|uniref:hypothetical protein n=1 Tax=Hahella sp. (strain CCB-MM4) TaxID=1926491 RepID=UPI000B9B49CE|nr:hypothetical protein [Hahella sp. CCB-MM4]OZG72269.1 hypothetical protein BTA51_16140 [Hahella sp. CCB-MM4]